MARNCPITGKKTRSGHNVSHANNKTKRKFKVNLQSRKINITDAAGKTHGLRVRMSAAAIRLMDKYGVDYILSKLSKLNKVSV